MELRALTIVHERDAGPGVFTGAARSCGVELEAWEPPRLPSPPRALDAYGAVICLGGAMNAGEEKEYPWLRAVKRVLAEALERRTPLLGVCLGSQLLAEVAGGEVGEALSPEIGWHDVDVLDSAAGDPLLGPLAPSFEAFQWHRQAFGAPAGAVLLASSSASEQAFRIGDHAWAIQFHAEVTAADAGSWIDADSERRALEGAGIDAGKLKAEIEDKIGAWNRLGAALAGRFFTAAAEARPELV